MARHALGPAQTAHTPGGLVPLQASLARQICPHNHGLHIPFAPPLSSTPYEHPGCLWSKPFTQYYFFNLEK